MQLLGLPSLSPNDSSAATTTPAAATSRMDSLLSQFAAMDTDNSHSISLEEFLAVLTAAAGASAVAEDSKKHHNSSNESMDADASIAAPPASNSSSSSSSSNGAGARVTFFLQQLARSNFIVNLFSDMDIDGNKSVSRNELIVAIKKDKHMGEVNEGGGRGRGRGRESFQMLVFLF